MTDENPAPAPEPTAPPPPPPTPEVLKSALKAFKKRMKVMRLDQESSKGHGPMSSGRESGIDAITPPREYPREVWEELAKQGKLRYQGYGLYQLVAGA